MSALHYKTSAQTLALLLTGAAAIFVLSYFVAPSSGASSPGAQSTGASPSVPISDAPLPGTAARTPSSVATPASVAQETVSRLVALFVNWHGNKMNQAFSNQAARYIDYEFMSSVVLGGNHWSKLSATQQRVLIAAFRKLIEQRYYVRWHKIFKHGKVTYITETSSPSGQVTVKTEIAVKDERTIVNWKLRPAQGSYKVVSLATDHRDLLEILRPRFGKMLSQHGFDGLMTWLNHKGLSS